MKKMPYILLGLILFFLISCKADKKTKITKEQQDKEIEKEVATIAIDPHTAQLKWKGYKIAKSDLFSHYGTTPLKEGYLAFENNEFIGGKFIADISGLVCLDLADNKKEKLENHLKSIDFFNAEKYPEAMLEVTNTQKEGDKFKVTANLTIKDKTNAIEFQAGVQKVDEKYTFIVYPFDIDRQLWGISYQSKYKDILVKDEITFELFVETVVMQSE